MPRATKSKRVAAQKSKCTTPNEIMFGNCVCVYSTCRDCTELMHVIRADDHVHPCCESKPTKAESLGAGWLTCVLNGDEQSAALTEQEIEKLDSREPELKRAALLYCSWGWPVFPLKAGSKEPHTKNGFHDATSNPTRIAKWWDRHPDDNIGLPTGIAFDVLDVDPDKGGAMSFDKLLCEKRIPECHGVVVTSSGGMHLYLKPTGKGNKAGFMAGLDYRGKGGYVVAPPSTLGQRGRAWSWLTVPSPIIK